MSARLTRRISLTILGMAALVGATNFFAYFFEQRLSLAESLAKPQVYTLLLFAALFGLTRYLPQTSVQVLQIIIVFVVSGPATLASPFTFFGMWFFVMGIILLFKYGFLNHWAIPKIALVVLYFVPFLVLSVLRNEGLTSSVIRVSNYAIFLLSCLLSLYFIFEEEIRDLLATNKTKEKELAVKESVLAQQAAEIARLEPLTVLGERVAHVAHSFKNNLNQVSTALFYLEFLHDEAAAAQKLREFSTALTERIDNILMVSRAGVDLETEIFDVSRLLEGLKQVYLTERSFVEHAKTEMSLAGPLYVEAVRWDFILMVENILKNGLEAIMAKGAFGTISIDLAGSRLTLANDGGAMATCLNCGNSCLDCSKFGRPGQTTKKGGTGHGLTQVFQTCRKNNWSLKIRTHEPWTIFEIGLKPKLG